MIYKIDDPVFQRYLSKSGSKKSGSGFEKKRGEKLSNMGPMNEDGRSG
jgi:hypothetical protein